MQTGGESLEKLNQFSENLAAEDSLVLFLLFARLVADLEFVLDPLFLLLPE